MDVTIHSGLLPHDDPDASLALYRDTLGFEVRNDVEMMAKGNFRASRSSVTPTIPPGRCDPRLKE